MFVLCVGERVPVLCGIIVEQVFLTRGERLAHHPSPQVILAGHVGAAVLVRRRVDVACVRYLHIFPEFVFTDKYWPEYSNTDLLESIQIYQKRTIFPL